VTDYLHQSAVGENIAIADRGSTAIVNNITGFRSEEVATLFSSGENHEKGVFFDRDRL
jgi:hypothetical protein